MTITKLQFHKFLKTHNLPIKRITGEFSYYLSWYKGHSYPRYHIKVWPNGELIDLSIHIDWFEHSQVTTRDPRIKEMIKTIKSQ